MDLPEWRRRGRHEGDCQVKWIILAGLLGILRPLAICSGHSRNIWSTAASLWACWLFFLDPYSMDLAPVCLVVARCGERLRGLDPRRDIDCDYPVDALRPFPWSMKIGLGLYSLALIVSTFSAFQLMAAIL